MSLIFKYPERTKKVRLTRAWLGNPKGNELTLPNLIANQLITRKGAVLVTDAPQQKLRRRQAEEQ